MTTVRSITISLVENHGGTYAFALSPVTKTEVETFVPDPGHHAYHPFEVSEYLMDVIASQLDLPSEE
jgi:hypothetical protein